MKASFKTAYTTAKVSFLMKMAVAMKVNLKTTITMVKELLPAKLTPMKATSKTAI